MIFQGLLAVEGRAAFFFGRGCLMGTPGFRGSWTQAAAFAERRGVWEVANADFAAAVLAKARNGSVASCCLEEPSNRQRKSLEST